MILENPKENRDGRYRAATLVGIGSEENEEERSVSDSLLSPLMIQRDHTLQPFFSRITGHDRTCIVNFPSRYASCP